MPGRLSQIYSVIVPESVSITARFLKDYKRFPKQPKHSIGDYLYHLMRRRFQRDYFKLCDKAVAKEYVASKFGARYNIPTIDVIRNASEARWDTLPKTFAMKATHASALNRLVRDKDEEHIPHLNSLIDWWLSQDYYDKYQEWIYKGLDRRVIFEELLDDNGQLPNDYKFHCFNGAVALVEVISGRSAQPCSTLFDKNWNRYDASWGWPSDESLEPPSNLDEMVWFAEQSSTGMDYVRVDLYSFCNHVYFGEFTFIPGANRYQFEPVHFNETLDPYLAAIDLSPSRE